MKSKSKSSALTLENIGKLIGQKLDHKLKFTNSKIVGIYGELDGIKQQIVQLDNKVEVHRQETKEGFDMLFDAVTNINTILDKDHEPRIKRLETKVFAQ